MKVLSGFVAPVKRTRQAPGTRTYDNADRHGRSLDTRARILGVAHDLLTTKGYRATTIAEIARTAGVHVDTIYELVGRKPALLRALIERAISGGDEPLAPAERDYVRAMRAEPDPVRKLTIYAAATCTIHTRMAPLLLALRDAASTEADAQQVWDEISDRRAKNMRNLVAELGPPGTLRRGLDIDTAADIVWATASAELFVLFTVQRHWSLDDYRNWLADSWQRLLLDP
jgi:AcrR family transcriptional regulator